VFLGLCTLVTLYFADEVPLTTANQHHRLSDSSPLLDEQQNGVEFSKSKPLSVMGESNNKRTEDHIGKDAELNHADFKAGEDHTENVMDGPGAVLVNLLTSLRHLPPAMHSVLIVMALTWVGTKVFICKGFCWYLCFKSVVKAISLVVMLPICNSYVPLNHVSICSCHGFPSFCLTRIGWEEKFIMVIQMGALLK